MNFKLLKELSKQAETECGWSEEKFAELIVRRCAEYCGHDPSGVAAMLEDFGLEVCDGIQNNND